MHTRGMGPETHSGNCFRELIQETHSGDFPRIRPPSLGEPVPGAHAGDTFKKPVQGTHSGYSPQNPPPGFGEARTSFTPGIGIHTGGTGPRTHSGNSFRKLNQEIASRIRSMTSRSMVCIPRNKQHAARPRCHRSRPSGRSLAWHSGCGGRSQRYGTRMAAGFTRANFGSSVQDVKAVSTCR